MGIFLDTICFESGSFFSCTLDFVYFSRILACKIGRIENRKTINHKFAMKVNKEEDEKEPQKWQRIVWACEQMSQNNGISWKQ